MGKVGSKTIVQSLKALNIPSFHIHFLAGINKISNKGKAYWKGKILQEFMNKDFNARKWSIVTLVRDPVAALLARQPLIR